jgi:hypothetical protein
MFFCDRGHGPYLYKSLFALHVLVQDQWMDRAEQGLVIEPSAKYSNMSLSSLELWLVILHFGKKHSASDCGTLGVWCWSRVSQSCFFPPKVSIIQCFRPGEGDPYSRNRSQKKTPVTHTMKRLVYVCLKWAKANCFYVEHWSTSWIAWTSYFIQWSILSFVSTWQVSSSKGHFLGHMTGN